MLAIKTKNGWLTWHLGNTVPKNTGNVVEFQADGDELFLILEAMAATTRPLTDSHIKYTKVGGFEVDERRTR